MAKTNNFNFKSKKVKAFIGGFVVILLILLFQAVSYFFNKAGQYNIFQLLFGNDYSREKLIEDKITIDITPYDSNKFESRGLIQIEEDVSEEAIATSTGAAAAAAAAADAADAGGDAEEIVAAAASVADSVEGAAATGADVVAAAAADAADSGGDVDEVVAAATEASNNQAEYFCSEEDKEAARARANQDGTVEDICLKGDSTSLYPELTAVDIYNKMKNYRNAYADYIMNTDIDILQPFKDDPYNTDFILDVGHHNNRNLSNIAKFKCFTKEYPDLTNDNWHTFYNTTQEQGMASSALKKAILEAYYENGGFPEPLDSNIVFTPESFTKLTKNGSTEGWGHDELYGPGSEPYIAKMGGNKYDEMLDDARRSRGVDNGEKDNCYFYLLDPGTPDIPDYLEAGSEPSKYKNPCDPSEEIEYSIWDSNLFDSRICPRNILCDIYKEEPQKLEGLNKKLEYCRENPDSDYCLMDHMIYDDISGMFGYGENYNPWNPDDCP